VGAVCGSPARTDGFANEGNLEALAERRISAYVACRRGRRRDEPETTWRRLKKQPRMMTMAAKQERRDDTPFKIRQLKKFGPPTTCYNRFVRWRKAGV
jgi:hypothetical protein